MASSREFVFFCFYSLHGISINCFSTITILPRLKKVIWVIGVLRRTVVGD